MNKLFFLSLVGLLALAPACCGRKKCADNSCKKEKVQEEETKSTLIYRDATSSDDRHSGPVQDGIEFDDLK